MANTAAVTTATPSPTLVKPNARQHLRDLFNAPGTIHPKKVVYADYHIVTINTHLTDLKNPKYAGKLGCLNIVRDGENFKRVELSPAQAKKA
jgi:hypothetical protein